MLLTVVVAVVDGGVQLERCLAALATQTSPPEHEVIVPWDDSIAGSDALQARHPTVRFLALGGVATRHAAGSHAALHELYDIRRAAGLREAKGELVAMLEDRSVPDGDWMRAVVAEHAARNHAVIGGAIADARRSLTGHADFLCDFFAFEPPTPAGERDWVSYVNIAYKRAALERTRALWQASYYDLGVHRALQQAGDRLWLAPAMLVRQERDDSSLGALLAERFAWGRRYAAKRGAGPLAALRAPAVPVVLWARALRSRRGQPMGRFAAATPLMLLIFSAWALGEIAGYVTGRE